MSTQDLVQTTKNYYDSSDADEFYYTIWGGEDIHVGIYEIPGMPIFQASARTIQRMVSELKYIDDTTRVLDIGSGYGGAARYLASHFGCTVDCLNLSEKENQRNQEKNAEVRLSDKIKVHAGNFEEIPFEDTTYDVIWSEDALLHSGNKDKVLEEVSRVLKPEGHFIFTDPMQADDCPTDVLEPILRRIHLEAMGSVALYRQLASQAGLQEVTILEMPEQLVNHYSAVLAEMTTKEEALLEVCSQEYIDQMKAGLQHWIDGGKQGYLNWGILHFQKKG
uniref:Methyltransferase domain-containing protein n=1 Tax=Roseihalotalea indica TaxID=2867963 RepID=A0AA49JJV1_9BACT|nr:methyltransferase domain-containing protein [Tunicatimonas sp. TK19036]